MTSKVRIGIILPEVLGTYGDGGNAMVLQRRLQWRGIESEVVSVSLEDPVPSELDIYLLGGGEDAAQTMATEHLKRYPGMRQATERGASVLAICAGMQVLGEWYTDAKGRRVDAVGMLDCRTRPQEKRSIGELVTEPMLDGLTQKLTGFENHGGATALGTEAKPLGRVLFGDGNAMGEPRYDGVVQGNVIATYMHGPVLARNPELADLLIKRATGLEQLEPVNLPLVNKLREERLRAVNLG